MNPRTVLFALAAGVALAAGASAQQPTAYPLRNVSAADAAKALADHAAARKLDLRVTYDAASNSVLVASDPAARRRAEELLAALDKAPPQFVVQMMFLRVPAGFAEEIGLGDGSETRWVLTDRERRMFTAAVKSAKERDEVEVLARPVVQVVDNQTGFVEFGGDDSRMTAKVTPRVSPDSGSVLMRVEAELARTTGRVTNRQAVAATEMVPNGGTVVVRGPRSKTAAGAGEVLVVLTVDRVVR